MEIKISTKQILNVLYILSWIIFIGLCIEAGSLILNPFLSLLFNLDNSGYFGLDNLYAFDHGHFYVQLLLVSIPAIMKTLLFYLIVKILKNKKLNISNPFNREMGQFVFNVSYLSFGISIFSSWGVKYSKWLGTQGVKMPDIQSLNIDGADVWLFMSVTLFVIAQIFKRGIEIQSENDLTI
ncbi:DUF2975 domain-containing protein [Flavobacterium sp. GT3R68]|uniref:DUF2975 domain-containing protein n=1 Tax=Flavobacterium sp. GT3R68 TaxID=2594437 RepID=UPI000F896AEE|nr:DUF2975 domain-containing protein [Flavobacterium sp. GT3R68]RTY88572.1 DUF2975 domain-containing protein [Flavobacterium sp. GSN2]TRW90605.1 DUF2975 domain-containing protein [Flavobacterium sp. GT3R68]